VRADGLFTVHYDTHGCRIVVGLDGGWLAVGRRW
jgi:hypothetical protein